MPSEFSLIDQYFRDLTDTRFSAELGIGDDAAIVNIPDGQQLVMSMDTLIAGVHFPLSTSGRDIAHKALVVNLSDLAAMGATPAWFLLSMTLPEIDAAWLAEFSEGLKKTATQYEIELIGGDTCQGPLSITIQVNGLVDNHKYIKRSGAQVGDLILVSGQLGDAAMGLAVSQKKISISNELKEIGLCALNRPTPRLCLTEFLKSYATAAIDLSDGLVGDLKHILDKSGLGAVIRQVDLPVNNWIRENSAFGYALNGGDDYELCFTVPSRHQGAIQQWNQEHSNSSLSVIGEITNSGYYLLDEGKFIDLMQKTGYQHFGQ